MHEKQAELVDVVRALIDALEGAGISYAIGGAIALAAWSEPRATKDVDLTPAAVVREALVETVGEDDVRVARWDELTG